MLFVKNPIIAGYFEKVGEEARAIRERVALIDQTSFAKFEVCCVFLRLTAI